MNGSFPLTRVNYFTGESLNTADFITEQNYFLQRIQNTTYSMGTWGIANGLSVNLSGNNITVYPGIAYDISGQQIFLANPRTLTLTQTQIDSFKSTIGHIVIKYQAIESDYAEESAVGGYKRIVEIPQISIKESIEETDIVLATTQLLSNSQDGFDLNYAIRRYCSLQLGSLTFASSSAETGIVFPDKIPSISGYYNDLYQDAGQSDIARACLKIESSKTLIVGKVEIIPSSTNSIPQSYLLDVGQDANIKENLYIGGELYLKGAPIQPSPWSDDLKTGVVYCKKHIAIGYQPTSAITEQLSVFGPAQIIGNVICSGAGSKFIGDGSGLTNLPNNPWIIGTYPTQNNIFYPGTNSGGNPNSGAVGIGPFKGIDVPFPSDASLVVMSKAYIQRLSGTPSVNQIEGASEIYDDLVITSNLLLESADPTALSTYIKITHGNVSLIKGNITIAEGNIILTKGSISVDGDVTAISFYGDGSNLTGVGFWEKASVDTIYYGGRVFVGTSDTNASSADFYVEGDAEINENLKVGGEIQVTGDFKIDGDLIATKALVPTSGNNAQSGIQFPSNINGGSGDTAWIRYYASGSGSGDPTTLEIGISNDQQDHIFLNPSGNVGIGVATPTAAKLVVDQDIAIMDNGVAKSVSTGAEKLYTIRGIIDSNGSTVSGNGYTSIRSSKGIYNIAFPQDYADEPSVVVSLRSNDPTELKMGISLAASPSIDGCTIYAYDRTGTEIDCAFSFIAMGA